MNTIDLESVMQLQPVINVGTIGHVANGKSTLVKCLTDKETQQFAKEKERNITIHLGYANAKIWRCDTCNPQHFSSTNSAVLTQKCKHCEADLKLVNHVSFVDCPGHNELTSTMLNGSSVMDYAILVESCNNDNIPAPQTAEHFVATQASNIPTCMIVMNKIDLVKKTVAQSRIEKIKEYVEANSISKTLSNAPIIPISASFNVNTDFVCYRLSQLKSSRDPTDKFKMIVIRSFDINKPGTDVTKLHGGVVGGTIMRGTLKIGDKLTIYPGMVKRLDETEDNNNGANFKYDPIVGEVLSIKSDKNELDFAVPGGLLGIQSTIDPAFTKNDHLAGSVVIKTADDDESIKVYDKIIVQINNFIIDKEECTKLFKTKPALVINVNSNNIDCTVYKYSTSKKELFLTLSRPVALDSDNLVTIINKNSSRDIVGRGSIVDGVDCVKSIKF